VTYLLEVYCLLRYDASEDLRDGILNNWLVNVTGELGKWIEGDLLQEHYNRWLEDMVQKRGGDFDDKFYRQTLSPNVEHFLRIKEEIENAFGLKARGKTHTSPHLRDELRLLLTLYNEENLHLFCSGRSLGHAAVNQFNEGYKKLRNGKLEDFIDKTTTYADILAGIQACKRSGEETSVPNVEDEGLHQHDHPSDNLNGDQSLHIEDPDSSSGSYDSKSDSGTSSAQSHAQESLDEADPSDNHLVSGSDYSIFISENKLMHEAWYEEEHSSDEEDDGDEEDMHEFNKFSISDNENSGDEYDSDYATD